MKPENSLWLRAYLAAVWLFLAASAEAAKLGLDPGMGDGFSGRAANVSGVNFDPGTSYAVTVGGFVPAPASVNSDAVGAVLSTTLSLPALPSGAHDVVLTGAGRTYTFTGAYRVSGNICLDPAQGNGMAGQTSDSNPAIPAGGWSGMVFRVEGWGFAASSVIAADSITVGGSVTDHPAIATDARGRFPSTTIIITGNLSYGPKDIIIDDGDPIVFQGVYGVRRTIGLSPACGPKGAGDSVTVSGYGFVDGLLPADSITIGNAGSVHPAVDITDGAFLVTVVLAGNAVSGDVDTGQEFFAGVFDGGPDKIHQLSLSTVVLQGFPNEAVQLEGLSAWGSGLIAADSTLVRNGVNLVSGSAHPAITATAGTFPPTWVRIVSPQEADSDRFRMYVPEKGGFRDMLCLAVKSTVALCPAQSSGEAGFSTTLTGFGFTEGSVITADSITVDGFVSTHAAALITTPGGNFGPLTLVLPALPNGGLDLVINDGAARTFSGLLHGRRTIGLSFVGGPGTAGEQTSLSGYGFTASSALGADTVTFGGSGTTHSPIGVGADGSFAGTAITLPVLGAGPHDVDAQGAFPQAYRVHNPQMDISKFRAPPSGVAGTVVTYSFSFTNTGLVGDPRALNMVLHDTLPAGMQYVPGSSSSSPASTVEWFDASCPCWTGVEPAPVDVSRIRWTYLSPLPSGASGTASFQVTVQ